MGQQNISATEFAKRRKQFLRLLGAGNIAVIPGASIQHRNRDVEYLFRQNSDFYYLTGFDLSLIHI